MALDTVKFINKLIEKGFTHLCVVPCSFAKNVINEAINNENIEYVPSASEAVACSIAAGLKLAGKSPIVIVQSSGVTNMGSCITSLLKPYEIKFPILTSWRSYNEGDSEIQHEHLASELPSLIESYGYEHIELDNENCDDFRGVFHCFTGTLEQAQRAIDLGFILGIGGVVTFKNGGIDKFLHKIDLKNIVLETDSPYLAPAPFRGKRNESSYIVYVLEKLSEIYGISKEKIAEITSKNAEKVFRL